MTRFITSLVQAILLFITSLILAILLSITFGGMAVGGNNGTVKIVDAQGDYDLDKDNDPHVCNFYVAGFGFDAGQTGTYSISGHSPTATQAGTSGSYRANTDGRWATPTIRIPDGHYKLTVNTGQGDGKHKVFWVECGKSDQPALFTPVPSPTQKVRPGPVVPSPSPSGKVKPPVNSLPNTSTN